MYSYSVLVPTLLVLFNVASLADRQCSRIASPDVRGLCSVATTTAQWTTALGLLVASLAWVYGLVQAQGLAPVALPLFVASVLAIWFRGTSLLARLTTKYTPARGTANIVAVTAVVSVLLATVAGFSDLAR